MKYPILESFNTDFTTLDEVGTSKILVILFFRYLQYLEKWTRLNSSFT